MKELFRMESIEDRNEFYKDFKGQFYDDLSFENLFKNNLNSSLRLFERMGENIKQIPEFKWKVGLLGDIVKCLQDRVFLQEGMKVKHMNEVKKGANNNPLSSFPERSTNTKKAITSTKVNQHKESKKTKTVCQYVKS